MERIAPPEVIWGERVVLRRHEIDRAEVLFAAIEKDRERLTGRLPWPNKVRTLADERAYVEKSRTDWEQCSLFDFGIYLKEGEEFLGGIGVHHIEWPHASCEIGYWIRGAYEGQGYVSESLGALESTLFGLGFHRIEIRCNAKNRRSAGVPRRRGYHLDGILRQDSLENGSYRDTMVFSKLVND